MSADDALREWSRRHGDYDLSRSRLVRGWVRSMHRLAAPLARRRVSPHLVTAAGVLCAAASTVAPRRPAAALVVTCAVLDGVDGAVAVQRGVAGAAGTVVDHGADRVTDVLFAVALHRAGARRRTATAAAVGALGFEAARDVARLSGHARLDAVTVGERPMRVAAVAAGLLAAPTAGAVAVSVLTAAACVQFARGLSRPEGPPARVRR